MSASTTPRRPRLSAAIRARRSGEQRLNAFVHAAGIWGQTLTSPITIRILAFFAPLGCTANTAALGGAAPYQVFAFEPQPGFPGLPNTWYPAALAEKLVEFPISEVFFPAEPFQAIAVFNPDLGQPDCLENSGWYYGLDTNTPTGQINLVTVLLHEFAHGLGFTVGPTSANSGAQAQGLPSVWEHRMRDLSLGKTWLEMSDTERAFSARNHTNLVWDGEGMVEAAAAALGPGTELSVQGNPSIAGAYQAEPASFGGAIPAGGLRGVLTRGRDLGGVSEFDACEPIVSNVFRRIPLVDRGTSNFTVKAQNAQAAGAIGLVIANNVPGLFGAGGLDPSIVIPVVGITQEAAAHLTSAPQLSGGGSGGTPVRLGPSAIFRAGTTAGFPRLYAPVGFQQGSSVSHFDVSMSPNMLMEPFLTPMLAHEVTMPVDLTFALLQDIGW